jgi:hypothetical protein
MNMQQLADHLLARYRGDTIGSRKSALDLSPAVAGKLYVYCSSLPEELRNRVLETHLVDRMREGSPIPKP